MTKYKYTYIIEFNLETGEVPPEYIARWLNGGMGDISVYDLTDGNEKVLQESVEVVK